MNILINCSNLKVGGGMQVAHSFLNEIKNNYRNVLKFKDKLICFIVEK